MPLERPSTSASVLEMLDRVLDKGIVFDAWARASVIGIDVSTQTRVVVGSIETYLKSSESPAQDAIDSGPPAETWTIPVRVSKGGALRFTANEPRGFRVTRQSRPRG